MYVDEPDVTTKLTISSLDRLGVIFTRGEPQIHIAQLTKISEGFTLSTTPREQRRDAIFLKNIYTLWNLTVDDEIDRKGHGEDLDASLSFLEDRQLEPTSATKLLETLFSGLPSKEGALQRLKLDIWEVACAFQYERRLKIRPSLATSFEYRRHCEIVGSIKPFLDIDFAFLDLPTTCSSYRTLRAAYEHISVAIKLASDIGTFQREIVDEDTLNSIRIVAAERGLLPLDIRPSKDDFPRIRQRVAPIVEETKAIVTENIEQARTLLESTEMIDATSVFQTASYIIRQYIDEFDPFDFEGDATRYTDTSINLLDTHFRSNPYPIYDGVRSSSLPTRRVLPMGIWMVSRFEDVSSILTRPDTFSSAGMAALFRPEWLEYNPLADSLGTQDGKKHAELRSLLKYAFTPRSIKQLQSKISSWVDDLLDALDPASDRIDFVEEVCSPLPGKVMTEILGFDTNQHKDFQRWTSLLVSVSPLYPGDEIASHTRATIHEIEAYMRQTIKARREAPIEDDIISNLVQAEIEGRSLTDQELLAFLFILLVAGYESTKYLLSTVMIRFTDHPEEFTRIREDPDSIPNYIDEVLRIEPPGHGVMRRAMEDVTLGDVVIPRGSLVLASIGSANRDPAKYEQPDDFIPTRRSRGGLSFGYGTHFCLGATLARVEAQVLIEGLISRFEGFERVRERIEWNHALLPRGPVRLDIRVLPRVRHQASGR